MSWLFISDGLSTGASSSSPVLPMNIQDPVTPTINLIITPVWGVCLNEAIWTRCSLELTLPCLWFRLLSLVSQDRTRCVGVPSPCSSGCDGFLDFPCLILMFAEALVRNVADVQGPFTFSCLSSRPVDHLEACFIWENRELPQDSPDLSCRPFGGGCKQRRNQGL